MKTSGSEGDHKSASHRLDRGSAGVLIFSAFIVLLSLVTSDGLYTIDEFIIAASVHALHAHGSLAYENGFNAFSAEGLKLAFFVNGPHGLVPQYPIGATLLGAALAGPLGIRGLIVLNALSAVATLLVTRQLAVQQSDTQSAELL